MLRTLLGSPSNEESEGVKRAAIRKDEREDEYCEPLQRERDSRLVRLK